MQAIKQTLEDDRMLWRHIRIARFGGPEVLGLAEEPRRPERRVKD